MIKTLKSEFEVGEPIYGVVNQMNAIMNIPITDNPNPTVMLGYFVSIDGDPIASKEVGTFAQVVPGAMFSREFNDTYDSSPFTICLIPSESDIYKSNVNKQGSYKVFTQALSEKEIGYHEVKVEIRFMDDNKISDPIASGRFNININKSINYQAASRFPAAKMNNESLTQSMIKALKDGGWDYSVKKINIVESEWQIHRNNFGYITKRTIDAYVGFALSDGTCKVFNLSFKQDYDGTKYGSTQMNGTGQSYIANCEEIK